MVILELTAEELADFYSKTQQAERKETVTTCNVMKQFRQGLSHETPTVEQRHTAASPPAPTLEPSSSGTAPQGANERQPWRQFQVQHFKPNGPATYSHELQRDPYNTQWVPLPEQAYQQEVWMNRISAPNVSEYGVTANRSALSLSDSYTQLPNVAGSTAGLEYLSSEPLPSILPQQFQGGTFVSHAAYPPNILVPQQPTNTRCEELSGGLPPQWSDKFVIPPNLSYTMQQSAPISPSFASIPNAYQGEEMGPYLKNDLYPMSAVGHGQLLFPANYAPVHLWPMAAMGSSEAVANYGYFRQTISKPNTTYVCELCSREFPTKYRLRSHSLVHTSIKAFQCPTCNKYFGRSHDLKRHMKLHVDDKRALACKICGKTFSRADALNRHVRLVCNSKNSESDATSLRPALNQPSPDSFPALQPQQPQ